MTEMDDKPEFIQIEKAELKNLFMSLYGESHGAGSYFIIEQAKTYGIDLEER